MDETLTCQCVSDSWQQRFSCNGSERHGETLCDFPLTINGVTLEERIAPLFGNGESLQGVPIKLGNPEDDQNALLYAWQVADQRLKPPWVLLTVIDVTAQRQLLDERLHLQTTHQLILDAAGEGIYGIDANGNTAFVNAAATRILGWKEDEIIGKPLHDVHHHSHADGSPYPRDDCPI